MRLSIMLIVLLAVSAICSAQTTWYVPDDFTTIQGAISDTLVLDGDTIIVRPGTYVEKINFLGKAITLKSESGPHATVIDGNHYERVVTLSTKESADTVLDGFTITNGIDNGGSGIWCHEASPTIINNIITGNTADFIGLGAGIYCDFRSSPFIGNNTISDNACTYGSGGGISCDIDCSPTIINNTITGNSANYSFNGGGGICCSNNCRPAIINNTITGNSAFWGGGIFITSNSFATVTNTILWDNSAAKGSEIWIGSVPSTPSTLNISYSDVEGGKTSVHVEVGSTLNWDVGMIDAVPCFVDHGNCDFHLTYQSPCKDTGDNSTITELFDFEGDPRITDGTVDMGADEFHPHLYLTGDTTPTGNVEIKFIGYPGHLINGLLIGINVFEPPLPCNYGLWYMDNPFQIMTGFGSIPADGIKVFPGTIPGTTPAPLTLYLQAAIDSWLTNLYMVNIQ